VVRSGWTETGGEKLMDGRDVKKERPKLRAMMGVFLSSQDD
jgi:Fe-S cluster assembly ATPase SufC